MRLADRLEHIRVWIRQFFCRMQGTHAPETKYAGGVIYTRCQSCRTRTVGVDLFSEPERLKP
jgi:hypothetical protein